MYLDQLESEIRNLNLSQPALPSHHVGASRHSSVLSSLGSEIVERRVIHLPPIIERVPSSWRSSNSSQPQRSLHTPQSRSIRSEDEREGRRRQRRFSLDEDSHSNYDQETWDRYRDRRPERLRDGRHYERSQRSRPDVTPVVRGRNSLNSYPEEARREYSGHQYSDRRYQHSGRQAYQRSSDHRSRRRPRSYSPPSHRESWSSSEEYEHSQGNHRRRRQHRSPDWPEEKPPSYRSVEVSPAKGSITRNATERQSVNKFCDKY